MKKLLRIAPLAFTLVLTDARFPSGDAAIEAISPGGRAPRP